MIKKILLCAAAPALLFLAGSCKLNTVKGNGRLTEKSFIQKGFKDVEVSSSLQVYLKQGPGYDVRIEAEENIMPLLKVYMEKDKLVIGLKENTSVDITRDIKVYVTAPEFRNLGASGASSIHSDGTLNGNVITLDLSGASNSDLDVAVNKLAIESSGASAINLTGKTVYFSVDASGNTSIRAYPLVADNVSIDISGAGDAEVFANSRLKVDISGAGSVRYKGNPARLEKEISGAGSVNRSE